MLPVIVYELRSHVNTFSSTKIHCVAMTCATQTHFCTRKDAENWTYIPTLDFGLRTLDLFLHHRFQLPRIHLREFGFCHVWYGSPGHHKIMPPDKSKPGSLRNGACTSRLIALSSRRGCEARRNVNRYSSAIGWDRSGDRLRRTRVAAGRSGQWRAGFHRRFRGWAFRSIPQR